MLQLLDNAFEEGWRQSEDFLRHFPPKALVEALANEEDVRVKLITSTTGVHEKLARRKSVESAADDLTLALEENTTTPAEVLGLFPTEVQVRCLQPAGLWQFLIEVPFWSEKNARALERMTFTLESALSNEILTLGALFDGFGFDEIARALPKKELEQVVTRALQNGRAGTALSEQGLLDVVPLRSLVEHLDLTTLWERVVLPQIAGPAGFVGEAAAPVAAPSPSGTQDGPREKAETLPGEELLELDAGPQDEGLLVEVKERLRKIDRLPRDEKLPLQVLTSIESMYEDLQAAFTDEERLDAIREAFPNETFLRIGVLALIDLLDPSIDVQSPTIRGADMDALLKIVLYEERKRRNPSKPASMPPPPPGGSRARSLAPPPRKKGGEADTI